jgi:hypothetical protein
MAGLLLQQKPDVLFLGTYTSKTVPDIANAAPNGTSNSDSDGVVKAVTDGVAKAGTIAVAVAKAAAYTISRAASAVNATTGALSKVATVVITLCRLYWAWVWRDRSGRGPASIGSTGGANCEGHRMTGLSEWSGGSPRSGRTRKARPPAWRLRGKGRA